jgi:hypothetical protein
MTQLLDDLLNDPTSLTGVATYGTAKGVKDEAFGLMNHIGWKILKGQISCIFGQLSSYTHFSTSSSACGYILPFFLVDFTSPLRDDS